MPESYMIVFEGKTREGQDPEAVKNRLADLLRIQPAEVSTLFSGVRLVLWRNLDLKSATALKAAVEKTGADCRIRKVRTDGRGTSAINPEENSAATQTEAGGKSLLGNFAPPPLPGDEEQIPAGAGQTVAQDGQFTRPHSGCPKCGYAAQDAGDDLVTLGQCPACGLVLAKYHPTEAVVPAPVAGPMPKSADDVAEVEKQDNPDDVPWKDLEAWDESEDAADWPIVSRGTALLALIVGFGLTVLPPGRYIESRPLRGLVSGLLIVLISSLAYQCYLFYLRKRGDFLPYALASLGSLAVLAAVGGLLYRLYSDLGTWFSAAGWRSQLTFARVGLVLSAMYLGAAIFLAHADQNRAVQTTSLPKGETVKIVSDGPVDSRRYNQAAKAAKAIFGQRFPEGERPGQYLYFKNVYVRAASNAGVEFRDMVQSLLPSFEVADFHVMLDPEVELLMFNAIAFRDELAVEGVISGELQRSLESLAWAWAEPTGAESRPLRFDERVALFDSRCPIDDLTDLTH